MTSRTSAVRRPIANRTFWARPLPARNGSSLGPNASAEIERMAILQTLQRTNWNKQEAAQILGLYRPTLYSKMKKHEIQDGGKSGARRVAQA